MLLVADIGNALITLGVHDGEAWRARWEVRSVGEKTAAEYAVTLGALLEEAGLSGKVDRMAVASAVPALSAVFGELAERRFRCPLLVVGPGVRTGLSVRTDHPSEVGADVVATAVGAFARLGAPCVAVDFGTATTFVAVGEPGALVGVAIAPGVRTGADELSKRAAQLPRVPLAAPRGALGRNTVQAMQAGVVLGHAFLVDGLLRAIREELGGGRAVATGPWAELVAPLCREIEAVDPYLTLEGIRLIALRNP